MKDFFEKIGNLQDRECVMNFVHNELSKYVNDLDTLISKIKLEQNICEDKFKTLKNINDNIIQTIEDVSLKCVEQKSVKVLGSIFRSSRPDYYYASVIVDKGFKKYRGYPGDFEMMRYVYNNEICSTGIIGKYFDRYFLENAYAQAVRGRKNKMVNILDHFINHSDKKSVEILNLPCGPARDIRDLLKDKSLREDIDIKVTCVDQDEEALDYASSSIGLSQDNLSIVFRKGNILDYIRHMNSYEKELGQYDLVYSIGLADYLPDKLLAKMMLFSFNLVKSKGRMTYAFKITDKDPFAPLPPKWFCDWQFVSRNLEESWGVFRNSGINGFKVCDVEWEESGRIAFLTIEKN